MAIREGFPSATPTPQELNPSGLDELSQAHAIVASAIGPEITAQEVTEFIERSSELQLLFHGIKSVDKYEAIKSADELQPLTVTESYWSAGSNMFYAKAPDENTSALDWAFNSTFFNYAWSRNDAKIPQMTIAVTDMARLRQANVKINRVTENGECTVGEAVNNSLITFFEVRGQTPEDTRQTMFYSLLNGMRTGAILQSGTVEVSAPNI